jgi:hypothetical protein
VKGRQNILEPISAEEAVQQERREIIQEIRRHAQDRGIANSKEQRAYLDGLAFAVRQSIFAEQKSQHGFGHGRS